MRTLFVLLIGLLVSACSSISASYTPYHSLTPEDAGKAVTVLPGTEDLKGSLQFADFKKKLEGRLQAAGFTVVEDILAADYVAFFSYGIDSGVTTTHTGSTPVYGQTGGGTTYHSGSVSSYGAGGYGLESYSGTSYTAPSYGVVGHQPFSYDVTTYSRVVLLDLVDRPALENGEIKKVYEAALTSQGSCGEISSVMDVLLEALFKEFPGESGKAIRVDVPFDGRC